MEEQFEIRLEKLKKIEALGVPAYPYEFPRSHTFAQVIAAHRDHSAEELEKVPSSYKLAGRIVAVRDMGKSAFMHLLDGEERLQIYLRRDKLNETAWAVTKLLDMGDFVGVSGRVFRTRSGELTVEVADLAFLAKALHPLPEKWHGLQDKEIRFRQRYLDMIVNADTRRMFRVRSRAIQSVRRFFHDRGYVEVETPMMHAIPSGAAARPFVTHHNALDIDLYLRVAPELYLKRLLVGGMEKVFEINRCFRNEGLSMMHNPEFTMLEFYELYRDFHYYMSLTEELLTLLVKEFLDGGPICFGGKEIELKPPFARLRYMDALAEKTGLSPDKLWDEEAVRGFISSRLPEEEMPPTYGKMLELLFDHFIEGGLDAPTFVTHFPKAISPLSKVARGDERETERFELYIAGMEIANAFSELNDPIDQRARFEAQLRDRERGDDEALRIDQDFVTALEYGMAPAAGEGIGIDRLIMLLSGAASIKDVILFPHLRPKE
jgi:lysyl-tRNA synthetase, class II